MTAVKGQVGPFQLLSAAFALFKTQVGVYIIQQSHSWGPFHAPTCHPRAVPLLGPMRCWGREARVSEP